MPLKDLFVHNDDPQIGSLIRVTYTSDIIKNLMNNTAS